MGILAGLLLSAIGCASESRKNVVSDPSCASEQRAAILSEAGQAADAPPAPASMPAEESPPGPEALWDRLRPVVVRFLLAAGVLLAALRAIEVPTPWTDEDAAAWWDGWRRDHPETVSDPHSQLAPPTAPVDIGRRLRHDRS